MLKKVLLYLVIGFALFYMLTRPEGAAESVRGAFDAVVDGFEQFRRFVDSLFA